MIIKKEELEKYLGYINLKGVVQINDILLQFTEKLLTSYVVNDMTTVLIKNELTLENNAEIFNCGIGDLDLLKKLIGLFEKEISIKKEKNKLVLSENDLVVDYILTECEYIKSANAKGKIIGEEKIQEVEKKIGKNIFQLTKEQVKEINKYCYTLKSQLLNLKSDGQNIELISEKNENKIVKFFTIKANKFNVKVSGLINSVFDVVDDIDIAIEDEKLIYIESKKENINTKYIIAPYKNK